MDTSFLYSERI